MPVVVVLMCGPRWRSTSTCCSWTWPGTRNIAWTRRHGKNGSCDAVVMSCKQNVLHISNIQHYGLKGWGNLYIKHAIRNCSRLYVRVQDVAWKIAINLSLQKIKEYQSVSNRANIGKCWVDLTLKLQVLWSCQERERVVTKGFMEREMRYAQEMRELPGELRNVRWLWHGETVISFEDIGSFQVWEWYRTEWNYDSH